MTDYKVGTWYKIDDIPDEFKDGKHFLILLDTGVQAMIFIKNGACYEAWTGTLFDSFMDATHFSPLLNPPSEDV